LAEEERRQNHREAIPAWAQESRVDRVEKKQAHSAPYLRAGGVCSTFFSQLSIFRREAAKNRGDWTPLELFLAGVRDWEADPRLRLDDGKPVAYVA
jgi:hypothetical protein